MSELAELIGADRIAERVRELAAQINRDYGDRSPLVISVLNGAFIFTADLVRQLRCRPAVDFLSVASYGAATESSGVVAIRKDLGTTVTGRDLLVVEDVVDTGLTLDYLKRHLAAGQPRSIKVCALLDKPERRKLPLAPDYVGFAIGDEFVVGYGLDYNERYRELASIHVLLAGPT